MLLLCWFDHFLDSRAEICQIFRWFFGKFKTPRRHSEINWPLENPQLVVNVEIKHSIIILKYLVHCKVWYKMTFEIIFKTCLIVSISLIYQFLVISLESPLLLFHLKNASYFLDENFENLLIVRCCARMTASVSRKKKDRP